MADKAEKLKALFASEFTSRTIDYARDNDWHTYRITGEPTHWFYLSGDFLSVSEPKEIVQMARDTGAIEVCKSSHEPKRLQLKKSGFVEVEEGFTRHA